MKLLGKTVVKIGAFRFICEDDLEFWRVKTLFDKEPGTIKWIAALREGDIVYDVGANIGLYSVLIAERIGPLGHVYALEPHPANVTTLLQNVKANKMQDRITILPVAVGETNGWQTLELASTRPGSAGHQLGKSGPLTLWVSRLDSLGVPPPDAVKIDVDGKELDVLAGLGLLRPRTIQVETQANDDHIEFLRSLSYTQFERHNTALGEKSLASGKLAAYNLVAQ
jgi:FkbM family methyltransferase